MLENGYHWVTGSSGKVTIGRILHDTADQIKLLQILWLSLSLNNTLQNFSKLNRANPTGYAFAAGNILFKIEEVLGYLNHAETIINCRYEPRAVIENFPGGCFQRIDMEQIEKDVPLHQCSAHHLFGLLCINLLVEKTLLRKAHQNPMRTVSIAANFHGANGQS